MTKFRLRRKIKDKNIEKRDRNGKYNQKSIRTISILNKSNNTTKNK
jgi:hypothetical protein